MTDQHFTIRELPLANALDRRDAAEATIEAIRTLAARWAGQQTDYDEDTEQQIADGWAILDLIAERAQWRTRDYLLTADALRAETPDRTTGPSDAPDALAAPKHGGSGGVR